MYTYWAAGVGGDDEYQQFIQQTPSQMPTFIIFYQFFLFSLLLRWHIFIYCCRSHCCCCCCYRGFPFASCGAAAFSFFSHSSMHSLCLYATTTTAVLFILLVFRTLSSSSTAHQPTQSAPLEMMLRFLSHKHIHIHIMHIYIHINMLSIIIIIIIFIYSIRY